MVSPCCEEAPDSCESCITNSGVYENICNSSFLSCRVLLPAHLWQEVEGALQPCLQFEKELRRGTMSSWLDYGCCHGIHTEHNTPNLRHGPRNSSRDCDFGSDIAGTRIVSQPRVVTRTTSRPPDRYSDRTDRRERHERSDRHERPEHSDHRHEHSERHERRDNTLNTRSDSHMNSRSDNHVSNARVSDSSSNLKNVHAVISGKVQGVYYRKWTVENATKLSLNGWVRNCKDGTVEAVFSGKPSAVDHMLDMCKSGPARARVANVEVTTAAGPPKKGFEQLDNKRW